MNKKAYPIFIIIVLLFSLALTACGGEEPAPMEIEPSVVVEPTEVEEIQDPSTSTGQPVTGINQITEIEQIVGTWIAPAYPGNFVLTIFSDGKLSVATSLEDLERGSTDTWYLSIENGQISATRFAFCMGDTGSYLAEIDNDGNLRFLTIIDACTARLRKMDRSLPGRLHDYKLIFRPVD